jgi:hypothetical protein
MLVLAVLDAGSAGIVTLPLLSAMNAMVVPSAFLITTRPPGGALISISAAIAAVNTKEPATAAASSLRLNGVVMVFPEREIKGSTN